MLVGLAVSRLDLVGIHIVWILLSMVFVIASWRNKNIITLMFLVIFCFLVGLWRGQQFLVYTEQYNTLFDQKVTLVGVAKSDAIYGKNGQLSFDMGDLELTKPQADSLVGTISVSGYGENTIYRGDKLQVEGKLRRTLGSKQGRISFANLSIINKTASPVQKIRSKFASGMYNAVPEPEASFALGLLIGQRDTLPKNTSDILKIVGLTHIIAVSGYNLTILVRAAQRGFGGRSKYQAILVATTLILAFLAVTGLSASIVRASIVCSLGLTAWYFGRSIRPTLLVALSAVITALWYPIYLWSDIGWYLSFLAFFGVLVLAPLIAQRIWKPDKQVSTINLLIVESFCAQIMTIPIVLFIFHQTSLVGLMANILVIPLIPLAMLLGLIAGIAGVFVPAVAGFIAWPATILLTYILDVARVLSRAPHAQLGASLTVFGVVFLYGVLLFISWVLYHKLKREHGIIRQNNFEETIGW